LPLVRAIRKNWGLKMSDSFRDIVANSPKLQANFHTLTDKIIAESKAEFGVVLEKNDLVDLHAVRVATLSGDERLGDTWRSELIATNIAVKKSVAARELGAALANVESPQHKKVQEDWDRLSIHQRMARARELDAAKPKQAAPAPLTGADRAKAIRDIQTLRGGARISAARKAGLA